MVADEAVAKMRSLLEKNRLGHAYIFSHPDPAFNEKIAHQMARAILCEQPDEMGRACGGCAECVRLFSDNHPGLTWLSPDGASLKIAQMRSAFKQDTRKTSGTATNVIVLTEAHKLTVEATNAILKWVEEPYQHRIFLFFTQSLPALLPTLRSRCVAIAIDSEQIADKKLQLAASFGMSGQEERFAAMMDLVIELGEAVTERRKSAWHLVSDRVAKMNYSQEEALIFIDVFVAYLRDAIAVVHGMTPILFVGLESRLAASVSHAQTRDCADLALRMAALRRQLLSHVNAVLALESALIYAVTRGDMS